MGKCLNSWLSEDFYGRASLKYSLSDSLLLYAVSPWETSARNTFKRIIHTWPVVDA